MEAFLHSSLGSSLCGASDNLVRSARKITHADKEHYLRSKRKKKKEKKRKKTQTQKNYRTGRNVKIRDFYNWYTHIFTHANMIPPVGVAGLRESERQSD